MCLLQAFLQGKCCGQVAASPRAKAARNGSPTAKAAGKASAKAGNPLSKKAAKLTELHLHGVNPPEGMKSKGTTAWANSEIKKLVDSAYYLTPGQGTDKAAPTSAGTAATKVARTKTGAKATAAAAGDDANDGSGDDGDGGGGGGGGGASRSRCRGSRSSPFPVRLFEMVTAEAELTNSSLPGGGIVEWLPSGRGFMIHDEAAFLRDVLPK